MATSATRKRRIPFQEPVDTPTKSLKHDFEAIYRMFCTIRLIRIILIMSTEKTLSMLLNNKHVFNGSDHGSDSLSNQLISQDSEDSLFYQHASCYVCQGDTKVNLECSFCSSSCCDKCYVQCEKCCECFCTLCSTTKYVRMRDE